MVSKYIINDTEIFYSGKTINTAVIKHLVGCLCYKLCTRVRQKGWTFVESISSSQNQ